MKNNQIVYFFQQNGTGYVKIGLTKSNDVSRRFSSFCTYAPLGAKIIGIIKCEDCASLEKLIHKELAHRRLKGEFFHITEEECIRIIERYNSEETNCLISNFNIWLSSNEADATLLNNLLIKANNLRNYSPKKNNNSFNIKDYIDDENRDTWATTTEVYEYIKSKNKEVEVPSLKVLGSELKELLGNSKAKKINGVTLYRYFLSFI